MNFYLYTSKYPFYTMSPSVLASFVSTLLFSIKNFMKDITSSHRHFSYIIDNRLHMTYVFSLLNLIQMSGIIFLLAIQISFPSIEILEWD